MRVGIITLYRGYNYGTSLQAYALRDYISSLGYEAHIIWTDENASFGRDMRIGKLIRMFLRTVSRPQLLKATLLTYKKALNKPMEKSIKKAFLDFAAKELRVESLSKKKMKEYVQSCHTAAVVCGSDQIWSAAGANVDPLYYLQFVPTNKRVAYAPSFGSSTVPSYNCKLIAKYLKSIPYLSVREKQGAVIVKKLIGKDVPVLVDPTLLLDWCEWKKHKQRHYVVAYFLDTPSKTAIDYIRCTAEHLNCPVVSFPYPYKEFQILSDVEYPSIGPKEFVNIIGNADCVLTDSFHGVSFSINMETPFWVFERNYGAAVDQSSRITSLLDTLGFSKQYITGKKIAQSEIPKAPEIDFSDVQIKLEKQRINSRNYLLDAFERTQNVSYRERN